MRVTRAAQRAQQDVEEPVEAVEAVETKEHILQDIKPNTTSAEQPEEPLPAKTPAKTPAKKGKAKATGSTKGAVSIKCDGGFRTDALKGSTASQATHYQPPYQPPAATKAAPAPAASTPHAGPAWDDKEGHYIIKPDEMVDGRCESPL